MTPRPRVYRNCLKTRKSASVFFATAVSAVVAAPPVGAGGPASWLKIPPPCQLFLPTTTNLSTDPLLPPLDRKEGQCDFWCQRSIRAKELHSVAKLFFSWSVREGRLVGLWACSAARPWPAAVMQWCCHPVALQRLERTPTSTGEGHANSTSQLLHLSKRFRSESLVNVCTLPPRVVNS